MASLAGPSRHLALFLTLTQALCWSCGSSAAAVQHLASFFLQEVLAHCSQPPDLTPSSHCQMMRASRSLASLLLHACDVIDSIHPLHAIASDTVETLAAHAAKEVATIASSPASSMSRALFVASAIASRAGIHFCGSQPSFFVFFSKMPLFRVL
jgi:hypothetical protein